MDFPSAIIVASLLAVLLVEIVMLEIFRKKILGIEIPEKEQSSFARFFTLTKVSVLVSIYTVFLCSLYLGAYALLW